jgi:hypothetical protein
VNIENDIDISAELLEAVERVRGAISERLDNKANRKVWVCQLHRAEAQLLGQVRQVQGRCAFMARLKDVEVQS